MPWPFDRTFMQLALYAGLVVGASAPLIGAFLVQKRLSLMGDGIGHIAFAGVAGGLLLEVWPVWSALVVAVAGALGIEWLRRAGVASGDLVLAVFFYGGIALGAVLAGLAGAFDASIVPILFGAILTVTESEVWLLVGLGLAILATVLIAGRALFAIVLDEEAAKVAGLPVGALNVLLSVLVAVTVVLAMRVVGILLVAALMVLPVGASQAVARSFRGAMIGASFVGVVSVIAGLAASRAWGLVPGGSIVLVAAALFALAALAMRAPGRRMPPQPSVRTPTEH